MHGYTQNCLPGMHDASAGPTYPIPSAHTETPVGEVSAMTSVQTEPPSTVECESTGPTCITDCEGRPNALYQSCKQCSEYIQCLLGLTYTYYCVIGHWDDNWKACLNESDTCQECWETISSETTGKGLFVSYVFFFCLNWCIK